MQKKITGREFGKFAREQLLRKFEGTWGNYEQLAGMSLFTRLSSFFQLTEFIGYF